MAVSCWASSVGSVGPQGALRPALGSAVPRAEPPAVTSRLLVAEQRQTEPGPAGQLCQPGQGQRRLEHTQNGGTDPMPL